MILQHLQSKTNSSQYGASHLHCKTFQQSESQTTPDEKIHLHLQTLWVYCENQNWCSKMIPTPVPAQNYSVNAHWHLCKYIPQQSLLVGLAFMHHCCEIIIVVINCLGGWRDVKLLLVLSVRRCGIKVCSLGNAEQNKEHMHSLWL